VAGTEERQSQGRLNRRDVHGARRKMSTPSTHARLVSHTSNAPHRHISDRLRAELEEHNALDMALWRAATQRFQAACMVIPVATPGSVSKNVVRTQTLAWGTPTAMSAAR
jgi:hypothetical protein